MVSTTGPVFLFSLIIYGILGSKINVVNYDPTIAQGIEDAIAANFNLNPLVLLPIVVIVVVCI